MKIINYDCEPVYGTVYVQSYTYVLMECFLIAVFQHYVIPFCLLFYRNGCTFKNWQDAQQNNTLHEVLNPVHKNQTTSAHQEIVVDENDQEEDFTDSELAYLHIQAITGIISVIQAFMIVTYSTDDSPYEVFYGFLFNSPAFTFYISCALSLKLISRMMNGRPRKNDYKVKDDAMFDMYPIIRYTFLIFYFLFVPPLLTHCLPGWVLYFWVFIAFFVVGATVGALCIYVLQYLRGGKVGLIYVSPSWKRMGIDVGTRLLLIVAFQTSFDMIHFLIREDGFPSFSGLQYLDVIVQEFYHRTQTYCYFQNALNTFENGLAFFSWT